MVSGSVQLLRRKPRSDLWRSAYVPAPLDDDDDDDDDSGFIVVLWAYKAHVTTCVPSYSICRLNIILVWPGS